MSNLTINPLSFDASKLVSGTTQQRKAALRTLANEVVSTTFFGQMLKIARSSKLKGEYGHGGRGEEIFGAQLDMELARRAGQKMNNSLSEAIYKRFEKRI